MKKFLTALCAGVLTLSGTAAVTPASFAVYAEETENPTSGTINDAIQWTYDTKTQTLTFSGKGTMVSGENDRSINKEWSCWRDVCTTLVIGDGITEINDRAFYGFEALTTATLPEKMEHIGDGAFSDCKSLKDVTMPKTLSSFGGTEYYPCTAVFQCCESLESIVIPEGITLLDSEQTDASSWSGFFSGCYALKEVHLPSTLKEIGDCVFNGCTALETLNIPEGVTYIGKYTFSESGLRSITIPDNVTEIDEGAFYDCTALEQVVLPPQLTNIPSSAFTNTAWIESMKADSTFVVVNGVLLDADWDKLITEEESSLTVPGSAKIISDGVFSGTNRMIWNGEGTAHWYHMTSIVLEEGIEEIGAEVFFDCTLLDSVEFPSTVKKIRAGTVSPFYGGGMFGYNGMWREDGSGAVITIKSMDCEIEDTPYTLGCGNWDDPAEGFTIRGYEGSTAEAYAEKWGYTFESLGEAPQAETPQPTLRGDVDESDLVDVSDAVLLARYLVEDSAAQITDQGLANADADSSGKVDSEDVIRIVKIVAKLV